MGRINRQAVNLILFTTAVILAACTPTRVEGNSANVDINEKKTVYSGDVTLLYRDKSTNRCFLNEQEVTPKGEYELDGATFVEISRHVKDLNDCDPNAYKFLIDQMSWDMNGPVFPGQRK
jgi:hypothetical protein